MYTLSSPGRRTVLLLLMATTVVWAFALWSVRGVLALRSDDLVVAQVLPVAFFALIIVAAPLVIWNLLSEWTAIYEPTNDGLRYQALGVSAVFPWQHITSIQQNEEDPGASLMLRLADDSAVQGNALARWLHRQHHGAHQLRLPAGLAQQADLLNTIRAHANVSG